MAWPRHCRTGLPTIWRVLILTSLWASPAVSEGPLDPTGNPARLDVPAAGRTPLPRVPAGFELTLAAAPPLVEYPTLACLDDQGRLYVSEGANVNDPYEVLARTLPRSIRRLEDTDGDGVFDRSTVFADRMTFPCGGVWHDGALYVASDPTLWRLEDTDGDGVADRRDVVITGFGSEGHASCMKGGFLGRDGLIYFAGGNEHGGYDLTDRNNTRLHDPQTAPCIFRIRPDGTGLEYFANGAAGVYDLCFDPSGDLFGVVTILKYPRGDGLMHWVYGGAFETSRPTSRYARLTGDKLPPLHEWPQSSPSGTLRYESGALGKEYRGNLFTAHFNTRVVTRNVVARSGATWRMVEQEDFVQSDNLNCRFTDVLEDADGSLLVVNTGGWFRIGCPTSQVGDGDLRGAIYRVRKAGSRPPADPRGRGIDWKNSSAADLAARLDDPRFAVRERAIAELARRGAASVPALAGAARQGSDEGRCHAVWALTRIDHPEARATVRESLSDSDETVVMAALHGAGLWRDRAARSRLVALLDSDHAAIRREAATALGRVAEPASVPALLGQLRRSSDRFLDQAIIFAVIEIDARDATLAGLQSKDSKTQRGALIALDQMPRGELSPDDVAPLLASDDIPLQKAALAVFGRHPRWSGRLVTFLRRWMTDPRLTPERRELCAVALLNGKSNREVQDLVGDALGSPATPASVRSLLLEFVGRCRVRPLPSAWRSPLGVCLESSDESLVRLTISAIPDDAKPGFSGPLRSLALDGNHALPLRIDAAIAALSEAKIPDDRLLDFLIDQCSSPDTEAVGRMTIARALGNARLTPAQLERLVRIVGRAGPLELPSVLKAFEDAPEPAAGEMLCAALLSSPAAKHLSAIRVRQLFERYSPQVQAAARPLLEQFRAETESYVARMKELEFALAGGDPARGQILFAGKAACSQCHRVDRRGSGVGPDLSQIGSIRSRRDLIEAVAFPSATLARGFEPVTVAASGKLVTGILRHETAQEIFLLTAGRSETAVPRDEIEEIAPSRVSIMPQGLDRNLTSDELRDLIAYLSSLKGESGK